MNACFKRASNSVYQERFWEKYNDRLLGGYKNVTCTTSRIDRDTA